MGSCSSSSKKNRLDNSLKNKNKYQQSNSFKVVLLGDKGVGKSSLTQRFIYDEFSENYEVTIGGIYHEKSLELAKNKKITMNIWDTGGEEKFRALAPLYYKNANAAIITYDITDQKSFDSIQYWLEQLDEKVQKEKLIIAIAGNKSDVTQSEREIQFRTAHDLAESNNAIFFETSCKNNDNVEELFINIAKRYAKENGII